MTPFRVLVTGSRECTDRQAREVWDWLSDATLNARRIGRPVIVVHGRCPYGGIDLAAHLWAEDTEGVTPDPHPADWERHGKAAGPIRNAEMVATEPDLCLAFPAPDSRGTWDCIRKAADAGIEVRIYPLAAASVAA